MKNFKKILFFISLIIFKINATDEVNTYLTRQEELVNKVFYVLEHPETQTTPFDYANQQDEIVKQLIKIPREERIAEVFYAINIDSEDLLEFSILTREQQLEVLANWLKDEWAPKNKEPINTDHFEILATTLEKALVKTLEQELNFLDYDKKLKQLLINEISCEEQSSQDVIKFKSLPIHIQLLILTHWLADEWRPKN